MPHIMHIQQGEGAQVDQTVWRGWVDALDLNYENVLADYQRCQDAADVLSMIMHIRTRDLGKG